MLSKVFSSTPSPVFQNGASPDMFFKDPVYAMISILRTHPLIRPTGAKQLVEFLSRQPQPSTILLVDSLNRFNINAFEVKRFGTSYTPEQDAKCRNKAIERADEYWNAIKAEIDNLEDDAAKEKIKLIRWDDIQDSKYEAQIKIVENHYEKNPILKEKIDTIAEGFIRLRLPQAKSVSQRLPFMVKYITQEMPILVTGHLWQGRHHSLMVYPTDGESIANATDNTAASKEDDKPSMRNLIRDVKNSPLFEDLRKDLIEAVGGYTATTGNVTLPLIAPFTMEQIEPGMKDRPTVQGKQVGLKEVIDEKNSFSGTNEAVKEMHLFSRQISAAG